MKRLVVASFILLCTSPYAMNNHLTKSLTDKAVTVQSEQDKNKLAGEAFLAANKEKKGVVTLLDGLQYKVIAEGKGSKPSGKDTVTVHYTGALINGTEFDSSYKRGQPSTFPVEGVIPGWTEALKLMRAGSTWELYIPAKLAYGEQGMPPVIGPNEVLIFKVNLIAIN
jgi:FKBP-type peptidyl-prolyl cis-trans isomerase FklB